ncbi:hypothetical protein EGD00_10270 [Pectobacterium carotovorum subsp. carotovorum]|nr:hypothetical protein EGD00_10270 [Pectobacterium carotovorum subsp. carotovorum]
MTDRKILTHLLILLVLSKHIPVILRAACVLAILGSSLSLALAGQRFALFKTLTFCHATRII